MAAFLSLPPIDTSLKLFDEELERNVSPPNLSLSEPATELPARTPLPRIGTPISSLNDGLSQDLLASAAEAVADALGFSYDNLPQPTAALRPSTLELRRSSSVYLPQGDASWTTRSGDSVEKRLSMALADVLGLDTSAISRDESFLEMGGNQLTARALRTNCLHAGLYIKTRDILTCKTIAELETRVTPLTPSQSGLDPMSPMAVSPLQLSSPISSFNASMGSNPMQRSDTTSSSKLLLPRKNSRANLKPKSSRRYHNQVEQVLSLNGDVAKASVLKPKAGLFEGQVTAFLTLASCVVEGPSNCEVKLLNAYYTSQLPAIRKAVEAKVSPTLVPKVWIVLERMPMDDSGKINRRKLQTWIQNANEELHRQIMSIESRELLTMPTTDIERCLQDNVARVLNMEPKSVGMNLSFTKLGGDATTAMQLVVRCKSQGLTFKAEAVLQSMSLTQLATIATPHEVLASRTGEDAAEEEFDLSPMQRLYFHTSMGCRSTYREERDGTYRFNQSMLLRLKMSIGIEDVRASLEAVVGHHSMLRTRFRPFGASWTQYTVKDVASSFHFDCHTVGTNAEVESVIQEAQANIDIENGPVFAAHHFHTNDGHQMLYLVAHHLVTDLKSWRVIADDLDELLTNGNLVSGRGLSFQAWSTQQQRRVMDIESAEVVPFSIGAGNWEYWGVSDVSNTYGNTIATGFTLGAEITGALEASNRALRTDSSDIFMAALLLSFSQTFRDRQVPAVWKQEHERSTLDTKVDISETVGWFTSLCPLALTISPSDDMFNVLCRIKDVRSTITEHGVPYFAANLLSADSADSFTSSICPLEIIFTYAGSLQSLDRKESLLEQIPVPSRSMASKTSDIGPIVGRIALFEVSAAIDQGDARVKFLYHRESRHQDLIHTWIKTYESILRDSIRRLQYQTPELCMSDIPFIDMTYEGLARLNREVLPNLGVDVSNIEKIYPVTANQQNILLNETLVPGSSRSQTVYEFNTPGEFVDIGRICATWQQVIEKHPALRTVFFDSSSKHGLFDQMILRRHSPNMLFIESEHVDDTLYAVEQVPPLNLIKGTPWHRLIVCQAPGRAVLKLELSQALCDAASVSIIFEELEQAYFRHNLLSLDEINYPEYLQCLKTTPISTEFWREMLSGVQPCQFPSLVSKSLDTKEFENTSVDLDIPYKTLEKFALKYKLDVAAVLRVAWSLVLRAYVGSDSACFGYRTSGRDIPVSGLPNAVGSFSTVLTCRLAVHSSQFLAQLLLDSEEIHREALNHQCVSVSHIHHALQTKNVRLFNTCLSFGYENSSDASPRNVKFQYRNSTQASEYDINIDIASKNGSLTLNVGHRILTSDQAANLAHAFERAIQTVVEIPSGQVKDADLFSEHDHQQILAWNSQSKNVSKEYIPQLIARQAMENSDIQAVCSWDGDLTYGELNELSTTLASHLIYSGATRRTPVPVIVEKGRWAVVAMLAVLKAGAILVPVDAELTSMFSWVIGSVDAKIILASENVRAHLENVDSHIIFINDMTVSSLLGHSSQTPSSQPISDDTACILFDADAAQSHKGITYSHGALATACVGQGPVLRINQSSRVMQLSSYSVDIALSEVFTTLINGACVCIENSARLADFTSAARKMNVNWVYLTPTLSRRLQPESLPDIAVVCFRTHQLDDDTYGQWAGKAKVLLAYGSAEACVFGLSASEVKDVSAVMCIGSPFCGNFWVVNPEDSNKLMPVGAVGELVISSPTLATGHDVDRETRNWFAQNMSHNNSKSQGPGRLLKTGHFVRYREHGQIELVSAQKEKTEIDGRLVKTAEVERRLRRCLGRSVDVAVEKIAFNYTDGDSTPILAAFVELGESIFHGTEDLTKLSSVAKETLYLAKTMAEMALRDILPSHMIPSTFIPVRQMPLTPSLEINRLALQKLIAGLSKSQLLGLTEVPNPHAVQAAGLNPLPLTAVEERMRSIWANILDISESSITATDGFVGLGGDRDLAHDLVVACREQGIAIPVVDVLQNMSLRDISRGITISDLPATVNEPNRYMQPSPSNSFIEDSIVPQIGIDRDSIEDVAEASTLQTMFVESGMLTANGSISYFVINANGPVDWGKLENACFLLAKAHPILRTAFASHNRQVFQTVIRSYQPEFHRYQCNSWRLGGLKEKLIRRDTIPVDFRQPVTKWTFLDAGKSSIIVLRLSRAQYNELSLPVLIKDLGKLYEQGDLRAIRPGFCDVVRAAQRASLSGAADYWRTLLEGSKMTEVLSKSSPDAPSLDSKTVYQKVPIGSLKHLGIPFETILKGAWSIVLGCLSGKSDVVFGHLVEGKQIPDTLGPSGNIIPVRTRLPSAAVSPWEYLRGVQSQHVASIPHENMQDIIQKVTNWPCWTRYSTVVQHQNHERESLGTNFSMGASTCRLTSLETNHSQNSDLFVRSIMAGSTNVDISLTFSEKKIHPFFAHEILSMLCSTISLITSAFIMEPIMLVDMLKTKSGNNRAVPRIPLPSVKRDVQIMTPVISVLPDHASAIHTVISTGWDVILGAHSLQVSNDIRSVPFYTFSPSLVPAGELARYYTESMPLLNIPSLAQASFTLEEILDHPTMMKQYELIISKQQVPQLRRSSSFVQRSWTKNIRRLAATGISASGSASPPPSQTHNRSNRSSGNSMESMTTGTSLSDEEMHDEVMPMASMMTARWKTGMKSLEVKKRSSQILGRIKLGQSN